MSEQNPIIHVTTPEAWQRAGPIAYETNSLASQGFIHNCRPDQLQGVLERHFAGHRSLLLLVIDPAKLTSELRVEEAPPHGWFPHIYGPIDMEAVVRTLCIEADSSGGFCLPRGFE